MRRARNRWIVIKKHVVTRQIAFLWLGKTVECGCEEGGKYRDEDKEDFEEDYCDSEDEEDPDPKRARSE